MSCDPAIPAPESVCGELPEAKQAICAAAMRCFSEHGTEVTSLRMVAETAGVSVGLVQHYFGTKAALIKAVDAQLIDILRATARRRRRRTTSSPMWVSAQAH